MFKDFMSFVSQLIRFDKIVIFNSNDIYVKAVVKQLSPYGYTVEVDEINYRTLIYKNKDIECDLAFKIYKDPIARLKVAISKSKYLLFKDGIYRFHEDREYLKSAVVSGIFGFSDETVE